MPRIILDGQFHVWFKNKNEDSRNLKKKKKVFSNYYIGYGLCQNIILI